MSCEELRERITADPAAENPAFERHASGCAACRAYRVRLLRAEDLIRRALNVDVPAARRAPASRRRALGVARLAAGAVLAAGVFSAAVLWLGSGSVLTPAALTPEELAQEVAGHWYQEPESWLTGGRPVSPEAVEEALAGAATIDLERVDSISFAKSCLVAGERIPHFVVQSGRGPIMVLLLPGRVLASPVPLELGAEGLAGQIAPAGSGSIAVLGSEADETERVRALVSAAVEWAI